MFIFRSVTVETVQYLLHSEKLFRKWCNVIVIVMLLMVWNLQTSSTHSLQQFILVHFFEHFEVVSEVCLLLLELSPGSGEAPPAAVAVPCARITLHGFRSTAFL